MRSRHLSLTVLCCACVVAATLTPQSASATKIEDLSVKAKRIAAQISANGDKIAALGERYNGTQLKLNTIHEQQGVAVRRLADATQQAAKLRDRMVGIATRLYITAGSTAFSAETPGDATLLQRGAVAVYAQTIASRDQVALDHYHAAQQDLRDQQQRLAQIESQARAERDQLAKDRAQLDVANNQERQLLSSVNGQLGALILEEQRAQQRAAEAAAKARAASDERAAAAKARAAADARAKAGAANPAAGSRGTPAVPGGSSQNPSTPIPSAPMPNAGVASVIAYARAQLGKPYIFNTAGPSTFDCSGLTMMAWAQAGVSMPHYSGSQFSMFPHVALSELQPGDLVFHGVGGADHVALYVGGGMQIAATHTGSYVLFQPVQYGLLSGAVRP